MGIHYFLIFALKHKLWIRVPAIYVLSKTKKKNHFFVLQFLKIANIVWTSLRMKYVFVVVLVVAGVIVVYLSISQPIGQLFRKRWSFNNLPSRL